MTANTLNPKLSILHCIPSLDMAFGGPSKSTASLVSSIADRYEARVSLFCEQSDNEPELSGKVKRLNSGMLHRRFWVPNLTALRLLRKAIRSSDVVHVHSYWNAFAWLVLSEAARLGKPVVLSPRGCLQKDAISHSSYWLKWVFWRLLGSRQMARVENFHFQSFDEARNSVIGRRVSPARSIVLDNGVAIDQHKRSAPSERSRLLGDDSERINLLFLGRLHKIKGIDLQIDAVRLLRNEELDVVLHLAGPDDGELKNLLMHAESLGLADYIRVLGPLYSSEKSAWLRMADAVMMSSEFENNSNVALEVMAAGGMLVATDSSIGPIPAEARAAIRVERNALALARGVKSAIANPAKGKAQRSAARNFVVTHHNWADRASQMMNFYRSLA